MQLHAYISGRVQGVGFRYNTLWVANRYGLRGWVRNLSDGRVETKAEGNRESLEAFLAWLEEGPRFAQVNHVEYTYNEEEKLSSFEILE